VFVTE